MIFVSPDGERSMNTYLGISSELSPAERADDVAATPTSCSSKGISTTSPRGRRPSRPPPA
jgi:sugar/nucleoside kinase (ribokinase family)